MNQAISPAERILGSTETKEVRRGIVVAEILRHAVEKQSEVDDIQRRLDKVARQSGKIINGQYSHDLYSSLLTERAIQSDKLSLRKRNAQNIVDGHPIMRLTNLADPAQVSEGTLQALNLLDATVHISDETEQDQKIQFAANLPVPVGLNQTYFGHVLTVSIEVLSIPEEFEWTLK